MIRRYNRSVWAALTCYNSVRVIKTISGPFQVLEKFSNQALVKLYRLCLLFVAVSAQMAPELHVKRAYMRFSTMRKSWFQLVSVLKCWLLYL